MCVTRIFCVVLRLRPIDIKFMKELHQLVNIIPVIAKADTLTPNEVKALKQKACELCVILCRLFSLVPLSINRWVWMRL